MSKFVVVVDCQVDFVSPNGALYVPEAEEIIIPGIKYLNDLDPIETTGVLFTMDSHERDLYPYSEEAKQFPPHCLEGTTGWANVFNVDMLDPTIATYQAKKYVFDLFEDPEAVVCRDARLARYAPAVGKDVNEFFEMVGRVTDVIEVWGVASDFCVKDAVLGLNLRGFEVKVVDHLCRGIATPLKTVVDDINLDCGGPAEVTII